MIHDIMLCFSSNGSAVILVKLVVNNSTNAPNVSVVLSAVAALQNSPNSTLLNYTLQAISNNAYAVNLTFSISNISVPTNTSDSSPLTQLQSNINNTVNTLLNNFGVNSSAPTTSNFASSGNQITGYMEYQIPSLPSQPTTAPLPTVHTTTTPLPTTQTSPSTNNGSAVILVKLVVNNSTNAPNVSVVLSAVAALHYSPNSTLLNYTLQDISNTTYAVNLTFSISNISVPTNTSDSSPLTQLQSIINNNVNTLLNNFGVNFSAPTTSNFLSSGNQITGYMEYQIPSLPSQPTSAPLPTVHTTTTPLPTTQVSPSTNNGSAVILVKLVVNNSTNAPNVSVVLSAVAALQNSPNSTLLNYTVQDISNNAYAVNLTFSISNISVPTNTTDSSPLTRLQSIINNTVNTLLNNFGVNSSAPTTSDFASSGNQITGYMEYQIPSLPSQPTTAPLPTVYTTTTPLPTTQASPSTNNGSAVILVKLVVNNSTNAPNVSVVLSAVAALQNSPNSTLLNYTLQDISNTAYAVNLTFSISNISVPTNTSDSSPLTQLQSNINNNVNTLLNSFGVNFSAPTTSNFSSSGNQITGYMEYQIPSLPSQPTSAPLPTVYTTTTPLPTTQASPSTNNGSAVILVKLVVNNSTTAPNVSVVLNAVTALQNSPNSTLLNYTLQDISNTVYAVNLTFNISNISVPTNTSDNSPLTQLQSIINNTINTLLNNCGANSSEPTTSTFSSTGNQITGYMEYQIPSSPSQPTTAPTTAGSPFTNNGSTVIFVKLVVNNSNTVPGPIAPLLESPPIKLSDSVNVLNSTLTHITNTSYVINITFSISNISVPTNPDLLNDTYIQLESIINNTVNERLSTLRNSSTPTSTKFMSSGNQVTGYMEYQIAYTNLDDSSPKSYPTLSPVQNSTDSPMNRSAVILVKLVVNNSTTAPNVSVVLNAVRALQNTPNSTLVNYTPQDISNTAYAVNLTFNISNISVPTNTSDSSPLTQLQSIINNTINTLINSCGANSSEPTTSTFSSTGNQITGYMEYQIPSSPSQPTTAPTTTGSPTTNNGSTVIFVKLEVNNSNTVPGPIVLLLASQSVKLPDSVNVLNSTRNQITNTSYVINITFSISNISVPTNPDLLNDTYIQLESIINNTVNDLLSTMRNSSTPTSSKFMSSGNQVTGYMEYQIAYTNLDDSSPKGYPTLPPPKTSTEPPINGSAVIIVKLVINNSTTTPNVSVVLNAVTALQNSPNSTLVNYTLQDISNTAYAVNLTFSISNISVPTNTSDSSPLTQLQSNINNTVNTLLNNFGVNSFAPTTSDFSSSGNQVIGYMEYQFTSSPSKPTVAPTPFLTTTGTPNTILGTVLINISLIFENLINLPTRDMVLKAAIVNLKTKLRTARDITAQKLNEPIVTKNLTYYCESLCMEFSSL
ncbi:uncharacterized protein Hap1MRO34_009928 [Clarias gariepinus]